MKIRLTDNDIVSMVTEALLQEGILTDLLFGDSGDKGDNVTQDSNSNTQLPQIDGQNLTSSAVVQNPGGLAMPFNGKYVTLNGDELVFAGRGLQFASDFATKGAYIAQSNRKYYNFNSSNHKCSTGAFEILGALLGKNFNIRNLNMSACNAWNFLKTWGTHAPLNKDGNGSNFVNGITGKWENSEEIFQPQPGDVAIWSQISPGHMATYLGSGGAGWVSDFRQRGLGVYRSSKKDARIQIYRLRTSI